MFGAIAGALIGGAAGLIGSSKQNKTSKKVAANQEAFQRETLQNQYQWATEDMRKAGLNPMLAYQQGGAGSASGASYSPVNEMEHFANSAKSIGIDYQTLKNMRAQEDKTEAEAAEAISRTKLNNAMENNAKIQGVGHALQNVMSSQDAKVAQKLGINPQSLNFYTSSAKGSASFSERWLRGFRNSWADTKRLYNRTVDLFK